MTGLRRISERRRAYLDGLERLVLAEMPRGGHSLLEVGAGDGRRAVRIAKAAGIQDPVLLEPSAAMRRLWPAEIRGWEMRAEELALQNEGLDIVTCLWNVLGRIFPGASRVEVLRQCGRLLSGQGLLFVDVNHRYDARHYGVLPTAGRLLRDLVRPGVTNGDVRVGWQVDGRVT